ncbi:MAG: hypothetical protein DWQ33_02305, partial [Bacteroidetes bacterium]
MKFITKSNPVLTFFCLFFFMIPCAGFAKDKGKTITIYANNVCGHFMNLVVAEGDSAIGIHASFGYVACHTGQYVHADSLPVFYAKIMSVLPDGLGPYLSKRIIIGNEHQLS